MKAMLKVFERIQLKHRMTFQIVLFSNQLKLKSLFFTQCHLGSHPAIRRCNHNMFASSDQFLHGFKILRHKFEADSQSLPSTIFPYSVRFSEFELSTR